MTRRGLFIALEGIDGAGKSTLAKALARRWRARGLSVAMRREPNDRRLGSKAQAASARAPWSGAMLFTLDRLLERSNLRRALERHDVVLTDRSFYSTLAYQGSALPRSARRKLVLVQHGVTEIPDRVVLLELTPVD
ncbi:MAG: dTMP kinase, partial [Thermoplasmata archaeon]|nr:dTMP kinase [Thermoplasmata archaeon]